MNKEYNIIIEQISSLKSISKSQAKRIFLDLVNDEKNIHNFSGAINLISSIEICPVCKNIRKKDDKCLECEKDVLRIIITEKISDSIQLFDSLFETEKIISLNFKYKKDFLKLDELNYFYNNLEKFISPKTKEIIVSISPSIEQTILIKYLQLKIDHKIEIKVLPIGVSFNSSLGSIDKLTLRKAFDNSEKI